MDYNKMIKSIEEDMKKYIIEGWHEELGTWTVYARIKPHCVSHDFLMMIAKMHPGYSYRMVSPSGRVLIEPIKYEGDSENE